MRLALVALLIAADGLRADGLTYRYTTKSEGGPIPSVRTGLAWIDGKRARVEVESSAGKFATLLENGRGDCTNLDLEERTFYEAPCARAFATGSGTLSGLDLARMTVPGTGAAAPKRDRLTFEEKDLGPGPEISGFATRGTRVVVSWRERTRIGPDSVSLEIAKTIEVWASKEIAPAAFSFGHANQLDVGPEEVRARLAARLAEAGYPLKLVVVARRKFDKGEATTETTTTVLEEVRTGAVDASLFEVPKGFRHEEPRIGIPTR